MSELPELWRHQAWAIPRLVAGSQALLWDRCMGKTRACGEALRQLLARGRVDGALVLGPVNALPTWERWLGVMLPERPVQVLAGLERGPILRDLVVTNPEILCQRRTGGRSWPGWSGALVSWMRGRRLVLIADEAHMFLTNPLSQEYRSVSMLALCCSHRWLLSGTPTGGRSLLDLHHLLRLMGPAYPAWKLGTEAEAVERL